jgi:hypothetical protein
MTKLFTNNLTTKVLIVSLQRRYTLCKLVCSLSVQYPHTGCKHKVRNSAADLQSCWNIVRFCFSKASLNWELSLEFYILG